MKRFRARLNKRHDELMHGQWRVGGKGGGREGREVWSEGRGRGGEVWREGREGGREGRGGNRGSLYSYLTRLCDLAARDAMP